MKFEKLTDEISIYIASKIPNIDIHTLQEMTEFLVYKSHNVAVDMINEEKKYISKQIQEMQKSYQNEIRRLNRAWEKEVRRIDKKYEYMANHRTEKGGVNNEW